jgi:hypothetical protein
VDFAPGAPALGLSPEPVDARLSMHEEAVRLLIAADSREEQRSKPGRTRGSLPALWHLAHERAAIVRGLRSSSTIKRHEAARTLVMPRTGKLFKLATDLDQRRLGMQRLASPVHSTPLSRSLARRFAR